MIGRILTELRAGARAPIGPGTALLGGLCMVIGASIVQRYVAQQQAQLAVAWKRLQELRAEGVLVGRAADEAFLAAYPGRDDVDPLGNGHHDDVDAQALLDETGKRIASQIDGQL